MNLRSFQLSDCEKVTNLLKEVLSDTCYKKTIKVFSKQLSYDSELVVVAEDDSEVVGVIIGSIKNKQGQYILTEDPSYTENEVGKKMVIELKERFVQKKVKEKNITMYDIQHKESHQFDAVCS
ncbi:GNAT family N-acetyltransferase [Chengkuizengella sediminis]|uniref:GNAT family N-acetyltransferase n=1 Tax=Chengkuizengella sediminis TaxID=1885917 RepID=UPI00138A1E24|nr:GNAT family N-acetyltransferase [Chengkuizengella sediminis]NDI35140.1 GNAT family N-acetyltransferase [Chengkuizengella sediminis]